MLIVEGESLEESARQEGGDEAIVKFADILLEDLDKLFIFGRILYRVYCELLQDMFNDLQ